MPSRRVLFALLLTVFGLTQVGVARQQVPAPDRFFGFTIGADGELARYPRVLQYFQAVAETSDRVDYEVVGKTTMGNDYALLTISAPANLARIARLIEINNRLADPRGLSEEEARRLAREGKPFYFLYATIPIIDLLYIYLHRQRQKALAASAVKAPAVQLA